MIGVSLAGINDGLELRVGQQLVDIDREVRPIARSGRGDRSHRRRLHQPGGVRLRTGNTDRLQSVFFIDAVGQAAAFARQAVLGLVGEWQALRLGHRHGRRDGLGGAVAAHAARGGSRDSRDLEGGIDGEPCRQMIVEPAQQRGGVRGNAGCGREHGRIVGGQLVDDGQPRRKRRAVFGIDRAVDGGGEDDAPALLQANEGVPPGQIVGREIGAGDRDEPAAGSQTRQR